tara:strand:+ start:65 stop:436 length:372 start_codon:yes stop_codon:yes gene_type:complete
MKELDEYSRVLSNPDNVIMSDSLKGLLDFNEEDVVSLDHLCSVKSGNTEISGRVANFGWQNEKSSNFISLKFICDESNFYNLLNLKKNVCTVSLDELQFSGNIVELSIEKSSDLVVKLRLLEV